MTFFYNGADRTDALDAPMGGKSFYALARRSDGIYRKVLEHFTDYRRDFEKHTVKEGTTRFVSMLALFNGLLGDSDKDLNDDRIAAELFSDHTDDSRTITGCQNAPAFLPRLDKAILAAAASYRENLAALRGSFKLTYRHADIVALLGTTQVVTKPSLVKSRVFETAYILDHILDKKRFLATALLLGIMHVERFQTYKDESAKRPLYNQGSALFTLLTFSYTPALEVEERSASAEDFQGRFEAVPVSDDTGNDALLRELRRKRIDDEWAQGIAAKGAAGLRAEIARMKKIQTDNAKTLELLKASDVQYGWRIFGSCLGIDEVLLPTTYDKAAELWRKFLNPSYPRVLKDDDTLGGRDDMLAVFDDALKMKTTSDKVDFASFGLTLKASAYTESGFFSPVARLVGWYTSSDHAGHTCSVCKTVHGSRVSLVRLWHRCPTCLRVYCPQCASGLKLYAAIAVGVATGAVGGWWWSAASKIYATAFGGLVGGGSGNVASKFLSRACCGGETEPLS